MGVYFGATEITGLYFGDTEITGLYFGDTEIWAAWAEYDGTLPAQYTANGDYLADYRIYGESGGVGDDSGTAYGYEVNMKTNTANLINQSETENRSGYIPNAIMTSNGLAQTPNFFVTEYIEIDSYSKYYYYQDLFDASIAAIQFLDSSKESLSLVAQSTRKVREEYTPSLCTMLTPPQNAKFVRFNIQKGSQQNLLVRGSAPQIYIPHWYTTQIYIGSDPLGEDEYVDYGEGKIYRISTDTVFANGEATFAVGSFSPTVISQSPDWSKAYPAQGLYRIRFKIETSATVAARNTPALSFDDGTSLFESESSGYNLTSGWYEWDLTLDKDNANIAALYYWVANNDAEIKVSNISMEKILSGGYVDPPVPLPALPTVDGTNIVDYAGQSAPPSRFYAKYKKG